MPRYERPNIRNKMPRTWEPAPEHGRWAKPEDMRYQSKFVKPLRRRRGQKSSGESLESDALRCSWRRDKYSNIVANDDYRFIHSLCELRSFAPDIFLNRTVHILFTGNDIPLRGELTSISHLGFIRMQNVGHYDSCNLLGPMEQSGYWIHYKAIGRVLLFEEGREDEQRYINITAVLMDLMKFKVARWLKTGEVVHSNSGRTQRLELGYTLEGIAECARWCGSVRQSVCSKHCSYSTMKAIDAVFQAEHSEFMDHALCLRQKRGFQQKEMRFGVHELGLILRGYSRIGGLLTPQKKQREEATAKKVAEEGPSFMGWDLEDIEKMSKRNRRTN